MTNLIAFLRFLSTLFSRAINALIYGGSPYQTFSARCYVERYTSVEWGRRRRHVNMLFFWQTDHCRNAWEADVFRAQETLKVHAVKRP